MKIKKKNKILIVVVLVILFIGIISINKIETDSLNLKDEHLVVYSCLRAEETKSILELFKQETGCSYEYIQLPTEEAVNRIEDEKISPKSDIFLSGTRSSLVRLAESKAIKPYFSTGYKNISSNLKDEYCRWIAFEFHPFAIVVNKESGIEYPKNFEDLADEKYKGKVIIPNPLTSGTGYSFINYMYETMELSKFEETIRGIKENAGGLTIRGYNVVQNVASGEYPIGVAYLSNISLMGRTVNNLEIIVPKNTGVDIHGVAIINKKKVSNASEAFVNFIISKKTQEGLESISSAIPAIEYDEYKDIYKIDELNNTSNGIDIWKRIK